MEVRDDHLEIKDEINQPLLGAKYISIERRTPHDTVFLVDDTPFRSAMPKPTHWAIAWSDLMMTMFVLFLSLFIYKTTTQDFLIPGKMDVIGGETAKAKDNRQLEETGIPFVPITPSPPLITGGKVSFTEDITVQESPAWERFPTIERPEPEKEFVEIPVEQNYPAIPEISQPVIVSEDRGSEPSLEAGSFPVELQPPTTRELRQADILQELYRLSKRAVASNNLNAFASVDLLPNQAIRITLTSDLLFDTAQANLNEAGMQRLQEIATALQTTPYILNIVGHTDSIPISSSRFASNWELSVSQASAVARFLINTTDMMPNQFIVSGYSSYRPLVPNTSAENRKRNRRIEIIISKRLARPLQASVSTLADDQ